MNTGAARGSNIPPMHVKLQTPRYRIEPTIDGMRALTPRRVTVLRPADSLLLTRRIETFGVGVTRK